MAEKYAGKLHILKEEAKEKWGELKDQGLKSTVEENVNVLKSKFIRSVNAGEDYEHHYKSKSRLQLIKISAAVMGIEFSYAAETAFVSPTLLKIGVAQRYMTLIWCLSPLVGFFLTPILGSLSDRCRSPLGRRRPFIILLSIGVVFGLILVPNGAYLGRLFGDKYPSDINEDISIGRTLHLNDYDGENIVEGGGGGYPLNSTEFYPISDEPPPRQSHPWGIFFTIVGTVLLDFDADACQSPSRAYLLDVTLPADHAVGLSTFTIMAGLGGSMGYAMGAIDWGWLGTLLGGHVRAVFTLVLIIFIFCVSITLTSFNEIPLDVLTTPALRRQSVVKKSGTYDKLPGEDSMEKGEREKEGNGYGSIKPTITIRTDELSTNPFKKSGFEPEQEREYLQVSETSFSQASPVPVENWAEGDTAATVASLKQYLWSIIYMPSSLRWLCLTNLFCWSSLVCYSLYFTDFVGQAVFGGDPQAPEGSEERDLYDKGVRFGCWGMSMYSLSCSFYSFALDKLVKKFRAKPVYIGGQLVYTVGMILMALTRSKWGVLLFSWSAGVMYSTLFTMPYLLVAHYHETDAIQCEDSWFLRQIRELLSSIRDTPEEQKSKIAAGPDSLWSGQVRGIGTDIVIVSCIVLHRCEV
ncbi:proton-associated sugar transporter A isoform X2 [Eurytemora carolleeae]|uniref:proton-associated sugar transporter A isoform X2 n=1 Tax=Eurytemora carolleeae TaxID=1294199 RepID=UPI000C764BC4|nr:proton-associated sugar transporter A isoform X2 [Eurytemora carolleeae]|eukprot:XP_023323806.1 proton-associated sugar transporter A-like isoform X2 [Eurytemora affinis]